MQYRILSSLLVYTDSVITSHPRFPAAPGLSFAALSNKRAPHGKERSPHLPGHHSFCMYFS